MKYDLSSISQRSSLQKRIDALLQRSQGIVDVTLAQSKRTIQQNKYLHTIISLFASEYGETAEYVKQHYFKYAANSDIFLRYKDDPFLGRTRYLRSSSSLTREEMQLAIERFRTWSSINAGIYLPSSEEHRLLELAEIQISHHKQFL